MRTRKSSETQLSGEWFPIEPGQRELFRLSNRGIGLVKAKSAGTSTVYAGVVAKV